jgi:hypothetical protein
MFDHPCSMQDVMVEKTWRTNRLFELNATTRAFSAGPGTTGIRGCVPGPTDRCGPKCLAKLAKHVRYALGVG